MGNNLFPRASRLRKIRRTGLTPLAARQLLDKEVTPESTKLTVGFTALPRAESVTIGPRRNTQAITTVPGRNTAPEVASCAGDSATRGLGMNPRTTPPLGRDLSETAREQVGPARNRDDRLKGSTPHRSLGRHSMEVASVLSRVGPGGRSETSFLTAGLQTVLHLFE